MSASNEPASPSQGTTVSMSSGEVGLSFSLSAKQFSLASPLMVSTPRP